MRAQLCPRHKLATLTLVREAVVDCSPIPVISGWCLAAFQPRCDPRTVFMVLVPPVPPELHFLPPLAECFSSV